MTEKRKEGALYIVSTPIGNLEDITLRALRILKECDLIAAEDTRRTSLLLKHYEISTKLISFHAHNEHARVDGLLDRVESGMNVAVVSDAGTPAIADPGFLIVREALKRNMEPEIIPGVSSLTFSVAAAGLPVDRFAFYGFLPPKKKRRAILERIAGEDKSVVLFESPHRMARLLSDLASIGPGIPVAVIREATKLHEEIIRGSAAELFEANKERSWKGECTVMLSPHLAAEKISEIV